MDKVKLPRHVIDNGGGNLWFRIAIPAELREHFENKTAIKENLNTTDPRMASDRVKPYRDEYKRKFASLRNKGAGSDKRSRTTQIRKAVISQDSMKHLAYAWMIERDGLNKQEYDVALDNGELNSPVRDEIIETLEQDRDALERPDDRQNISYLQKQATELLQGNGYEILLTNPAFHDLVDLLRQAEIETINRSIQRYDGRVTQNVFNPQFQEAATATTADGMEHQSRISNKTLGELIEQFETISEEEGDGPSSDNKKNTYKNAFAILRDLFGSDLPVSSINRAMIDEYRSYINILPLYAKSKFPNKSYRDIREAVSTKKLKTINPQTKNTYLTPVRKLIEFAYEYSYVDDERLKAIKDFKVADSDKKEISAFNCNELSILFDPMHYPQKPDLSSLESKVALDAAYKFYIPLLCLYTGARLNEICQLLITDIVRVGDVWSIDHNITDENKTKRLKNKSSRRRIPIHSDLVTFGFLDYVQALKKQGKEQLFPAFKPDSKGYYSGKASKWFARYRKQRKVGAEREGIHRFRHTFRTVLEEAQVPFRIAQALGGWKREGGTDLNYLTSLRERGEKEHKDMQAHVEKFSTDTVKPLMERDLKS